MELLIGIALGFVVLGPKRMHEMLGHVGHAKAAFDKATRGIKTQLVSELGAQSSDREASNEALRP